MRNFFTYIALLMTLMIAGCGLSGSESMLSSPAQSATEKETTASTEPIAPDVLRFSNGAINLAGIPNNGAFVLVFAAPVSKEESSGVARNIFHGTVTSRALMPTGMPQLVEVANKVKEEDEDDGSQRLFSPTDRQRLMDGAATAEGNFAEVQRGMVERTGKAFVVGDVWNSIKVLNWSSNAYFAINAECIGVSASAYFMKEVGSSAIPPELLQNYMNNFDNSYEKIRTNFAPESDVDNNGKVIILFYDMKSTRILGYFNPIDKNTAANSNLADIFYINIIDAYIPKNTEQINFTLAHEFQHMVFHDNKNVDVASYNASTWLDEGLSMLAGYVAGFYKDGSDSYVKGFISKYHTLSLTNWTDKNYGYSMLFTVYLYERFGIETIKQIYTTPSAGWLAVEEVTGKDFNLLFGDFIVALAVSGRGHTNDPRYNFKGIDFNKYLPGALFNLTPIGTHPIGTSYGVTVYPYGLSLRELSGATVGLFLKGAPTGFAVIKK